MSCLLVNGLTCPVCPHCPVCLVNGLITCPVCPVMFQGDPSRHVVIRPISVFISQHVDSILFSYRKTYIRGRCGVSWHRIYSIVTVNSVHPPGPRASENTSLLLKGRAIVKYTDLKTFAAIFTQKTIIYAHKMIKYTTQQHRKQRLWTSAYIRASRPKWALNHFGLCNCNCTALARG